jgi:hypothetical protein
MTLGMVADPSRTSGDAGPDRKQRRGHSAATWGLAAFGCIGAAVLAFVGYMFVPSLLDAVVYTLFGLALVLAVCVLMTLIRFGEYLLTPAQPGSRSMSPASSHPNWHGNLSSEMDSIMARAQGNDRWVTRAQILFGACALCLFVAVLIPRVFGIAIWLAVVLGASAFVSLAGLVIHNSRLAAAVDTLNRDTVTEYGPELARKLRRRSLLVPFHWWEWLGMFLLVVVSGIATLVFLNKGQQAGWLPRAHDIASGIASSVGAVIVVGIVMVWGIFRSPALEDRRGAMVLVTLIAVLITLPLGIVGSLAGWRPFVSSYSGRGAGLILGVVFIAVWLIGYRVTKPTRTS